MSAALKQLCGSVRLVYTVSDSEVAVLIEESTSLEPGHTISLHLTASDGQSCWSCQINDIFLKEVATILRLTSWDNVYSVLISALEKQRFEETCDSLVLPLKSLANAGKLTLRRSADLSSKSLLLPLARRLVALQEEKARLEQRLRIAEAAPSVSIFPALASGSIGGMRRGSGIAAAKRGRGAPGMSVLNPSLRKKKRCVGAVFADD